MNDMDFQLRLRDAMPDVPDCFHHAMTKTLDAIVINERVSCAQAVEKPQRFRRGTRRTLVLALILVLLLATVAVAAYHWRVFDAIWFHSTPPQNLDTVMQSNLHQETVNNVEITIREAGYDGRTLYLMYSFRMLDVDRCLGVNDEGVVEMGFYAEDEQLLYDHNVGWFFDGFWINGRYMSATSNSGSTMSGSTTPGELVRYDYWRLDNGDVSLSGQVEIALPIGNKPAKRYNMIENPEMFTENGDPLMPEDGLVKFTIDASDILARVVTEHPNKKVVLPEVTIWVSEISITPMQTYVIMEMEPDADALAAYKAEHGEGFLDDQGNLYWSYSGTDVYAWAQDMSLVDGDGRVLFPNEYPNNGFGERWAEFLFPTIEQIPGELYMAPLEDGVPDMARAVPARE